MKSPLKKKSKLALRKSEKRLQEGNEESESSSDEEYSPAQERSFLFSDDDDDGGGDDDDVDDDDSDDDDSEDDNESSFDGKDGRSVTSEEDGEDMSVASEEDGEDMSVEEEEEEVEDDEDEEDEEEEVDKVDEEMEEENEDVEDEEVCKGVQEENDLDNKEDVEKRVRVLAEKNIDEVSDSSGTNLDKDRGGSLTLTSSVSTSASLTCAKLQVSASSLTYSKACTLIPFKPLTQALSGQIQPASPKLIATVSLSTNNASQLAPNFSQCAHTLSEAPCTATVTPSPAELVSSSCSTVLSTIQVNTISSSSISVNNSTQQNQTSSCSSSPSDTAMLSPLPPSPPPGFPMNTAPLLSPIRSPIQHSTTACTSLVPPPDRNLIYETAALLASMSDPSHSPMKGLMSGSPFKVDVAQSHPAAKTSTSTSSCFSQGSALTSSNSALSVCQGPTCSQGTEQPMKSNHVRFSCTEQTQNDGGLTERRIMESCSEIPDMSATASTSQFQAVFPEEFSEVF